MSNYPPDRRAYRLRLYATGTFGWLGAMALVSGIVAALSGIDWGQRLAGVGVALVSVANEVDPTIELPWTVRTGLALIGVFGAMVGISG